MMMECAYMPGPSLPVNKGNVFIMIHNVVAYGMHFTGPEGLPCVLTAVNNVRSMFREIYKVWTDGKRSHSPRRSVRVYRVIHLAT